MRELITRRLAAFTVQGHDPAQQVVRRAAVALVVVEEGHGAEVHGIARLRVIVNALTRLRFCSPAGAMEFASKEGADGAPPGYLPWFDVPGRRTGDKVVAFGHWSTLGWLDRPDVIALDSGCVWGGCLSALRWHPSAGRRALIQVRCPQAQAPGAG